MARIPAAEVQAELDLIESLIAQHPRGIARATLEKAFAESQGRRILQRTLARRLERLVADDRVRVGREGIQVLYQPGPALVLTPPPPEEGYVPLTRGGAQVRALVRRPMVDRKPVGYDGAFLRSYQPGRTWFLPASTRQRLHEVGRTPDSARPAGTYAREILSRLLIDLAWASSRLEGNTYTRLDTQNLLEFGQRAEGKDATEAQMILNHKAAIELLVDEAEQIDFDIGTLHSIHAALSENLLGDPADEGRLRTRVVDITGTTFRPLGIPQQIEEYFRLLLDKAGAIADPFEQAFFVMVHIPYLQPFTDVNKRTSRIAANIPLVKANLCPLSFVDVPEQAYVEGNIGIYELKRVDLLRDVFVWAYERSCAQYRIVREALGEPDPVRMRYREELAAAVRETVLNGAPPQERTLLDWASRHGVPEADRHVFAERALGLLVNLHSGALYRYRLRQSDFSSWKSKFAKP